jgi:hypothetical protein
MGTDALAKKIPGIGNTFAVKVGAPPLRALSAAAKIVHQAHTDVNATKRRFAQAAIGRTYVAAKRGDSDAQRALALMTTAKKGLKMAHAKQLRTLDTRVKAHVASNAPMKGVLVLRRKRGAPVQTTVGSFVREKGGVDGSLIVASRGRHYHIRGHFRKVG